MSGGERAGGPGDPAQALCFVVRLDNPPLTLGAFTGCEGLGAEYDIQEYQEGGENTFVHRMPGRLKCSNVKLTRPVDADSPALAAFFSTWTEEVRSTTATIIAFDANRDPVCQWQLQGVVPVRWTGPSFRSDDSSVAKESLELAYHGFGASKGG